MAPGQHGWTVETLRLHLEALIASNDTRYEQRFLAQQQALADALNAVKEAVAARAVNDERWRLNANEWRDAMDDREQTFQAKALADQQYKDLSQRIIDAGTRRDAQNEQLRKEIEALKLNESKHIGSTTMAAAVLSSGLIILGLILAAIRVWK